MKTRKISLSRLLFEQDENQTIPTDVASQATQQPQNYSLDQKVDHFLIQYERESNPSAAMFPDDSGLNNAITTQSGNQSVGAGFGGGQSAVATPVAMKTAIAEKKKKNSLKSFLWEQDDPLAGGDPGAAGAVPDLAGGGGDLSGMGGPDDLTNAGGGEEGTAPSEPTVSKPQINLSIFSNKLARLIDNFDSLVNPKIIVLNRAYAYIRQNYDENTAKELMIILETNYNISNMTLLDKEKNMVGTIPVAVGAGDGGAGAGGGT